MNKNNIFYSSLFCATLLTATDNITSAQEYANKQEEPQKAIEYSWAGVAFLGGCGFTYACHKSGDEWNITELILPVGLSLLGFFFQNVQNLPPEKQRKALQDAERLVDRLSARR